MILIRHTVYLSHAVLSSEYPLETMMLGTAPQPSTPAERKRRHHHRSRNGCFSCKQKHMRCDEDKPICRNCLKNGSRCGYARVESSCTVQPHIVSAPKQVTSNSLLCAYLKVPTTSGGVNPSSDPSSYTPPSPLTSAFGVEMVDPFNGFPVEMGRNSNMLLDHCKWSR